MSTTRPEDEFKQENDKARSTFKKIDELYNTMIAKWGEANKLIIRRDDESLRASVQPSKYPNLKEINPETEADIINTRSKEINSTLDELSEKLDDLYEEINYLNENAKSEPRLINDWIAQIKYANNNLDDTLKNLKNIANEVNKFQTLVKKAVGPSIYSTNGPQTFKPADITREKTTTDCKKTNEPPTMGQS